MDTNNLVDYKSENGVYWKVLFGLLVFTAVTLVQPSYFMVENTFLAQMVIGVIKAWLIVVYYMHLKGEKLITGTVWFAMSLVAFFFLIVVMDVNNFQYKDGSHITNDGAHAGKSIADRHFEH